MSRFSNSASSIALAAAAILGLSAPAMSAQVFATDVIVQGSLCVGQDCANGESFGFDTIRLKENNLRIHFQDTSNSGSFPTTDWRIVINDTTNGGASYFAVQNADAGSIPFRILSGAPANSLYVDDQGDVGVGTSNPVVELQVTDGDSPTLRLEQNGSSGFTAQTWDIAGNETNFFVRDVTHGSRLPFRIEPNTPANTVYMDSTGHVGMGTNNPDEAVLDVRSSEGSLASFSGNGTKFLHLTSNDGGGVQIRLEADSPNRRIIAMDSTGDNRHTQIIFNDTDIRFGGTNDIWATIDETGLTTVGPTCNPGPCDRTYDPDYFQVASIEDHAASMWENRYLEAVGPTSPDQPFNVTEKVGGMLHELEVAHIYIEQLNSRLVALEQQVAEAGSQRDAD
ncbi:hypothetical protein [Maricaulis sp.]|uniref:hypothetical protein n=1 Tax=Maricaulis sp. TaxID=1486257 RepID=UPI003A9239EE